MSILSLVSYTYPSKVNFAFPFRHVVIVLNMSLGFVVAGNGYQAGNNLLQNVIPDLITDLVPQK